MKNFPHQYSVVAGAHPGEDFELISRGLPPLKTAAPAEFDGPGDRWSPETMLTGAIAGCFILTFRAIARASKIAWNTVTCEVDGRLDRLDNVTQFTRFDLRVRLLVPATTDTAQAHRALERAERQCLISNSLRATFDLRIDVDIVPTAEPIVVGAA